MADIFIEELLGYMNLIHHLSVIENASKTQKMILNIADVIKYKYVRKDEIVTLSEELAQIQKLIEIFKTRFGENLEFTNHISNCFQNVYFPNYSVTTFVENALFHGLISKEGVWKLALDADENEETIKIQIFDNGIGFDPSKLDSSFESADSIGTISSAIKKANEYFMREGLVNISSTIGKGTRVTINIPI